MKGDAQEIIDRNLAATASREAVRGGGKAEVGRVAVELFQVIATGQICYRTPRGSLLELIEAGLRAAGFEKGTMAEFRVEVSDGCVVATARREWPREEGS